MLRSQGPVLRPQGRVLRIQGLVLRIQEPVLGFREPVLGFREPVLSFRVAVESVVLVDKPPAGRCHDAANTAHGPRPGAAWMLTRHRADTTQGTAPASCEHRPLCGAEWVYFAYSESMSPA